MSVVVQLKHLETGEISDRFSVDAAEMLARGTHIQVGGPKVAFNAAPKPKPAEPGAPTAQPQTTGPQLKKAFGGKWNVVAPDGTKISTQPLSRADAEALLLKLQQA